MIEPLIIIVILLLAAVVCAVRCPRKDNKKLVRMRRAGF